VTIVLSRTKIKEVFSTQVEAASEGNALAHQEGTTVLIHTGPAHEIPSVCPFCGNATGPGADMHRRCFKRATPAERFLVLDAQLEVMAERNGLSIEFVREFYQGERRICQNCHQSWDLVDDGWECPTCINI
jgi:hypothetical protein